MIIISPGKANPDIILQKSAGGTPFNDSLFAVVAKARVDSALYKMASTVSVLKTLPKYYLPTPQKVYFASTSNNDAVGGTGLNFVNGVGLDSNYILQEELIGLNGQTPVESTLDYSRFFEMLGVIYGSNTDTVTGDLKNVGTIYAGTGAFVAGVPANPIVAISPVDNDPNSRTGIFTTFGDSFTFLKAVIAFPIIDEQGGVLPPPTSPTLDDSLIVTIAIRVFGLPNWFKFPEMSFEGFGSHEPPYYLPIPPKTDIQIRVRKQTVNNQDITATIMLILETQTIQG